VPALVRCGPRGYPDRHSGCRVSGYSTVTVFRARNPVLARATNWFRFTPSRSHPDSRLQPAFAVGIRLSWPAESLSRCRLHPTSRQSARADRGSPCQHDLALLRQISHGQVRLGGDALKESRLSSTHRGAHSARQAVVFGAQAPCQTAAFAFRDGARACEVRRVPFSVCRGPGIDARHLLNVPSTPVLRALAGGEPAPLLFASARLKTGVAYACRTHAVFCPPG